MVRNLSEDELHRNAKEFELLYLLPKESDGKELDIRLKIGSTWSGPTIRNEIISSFGLEVGNTILAKVKPMFLNGLIDDDNEITLFAEGNAARWIIEHNITKGCTIECRIRFLYKRINIGGNNKENYRLCLVLEEGYDIFSLPNEKTREDEDTAVKLFREILEANQR